MFKKNNPRGPLNFNFVQNLHEILILIWWKLPSEKTQVFQYAVLCLFTTGKLEQPTIKLLLGEKWILQGRARCVVCRSKVRPLMLCKPKGGGGRGQRHQNWQFFPFYKKMTSWVDFQSPKGLCWWGNFVPRTRRPSVNINMQTFSALKQHSQNHIHPADRSVTFLQSLPILFLNNWTTPLINSSCWSLNLSYPNRWWCLFLKSKQNTFLLSFRPFPPWITHLPSNQTRD